MLYRTHVRHALEEKRDRFVSFERSLRGEVGELASRLRALAGRTAAEVRAESGAVADKVTYPSDELERAGAYRVYQDPADLLEHIDEVGVRVLD